MDILRTIRLQRYITHKKVWSTANITQSRTSAIDLAHRIHGPSPTPDTVPIFVLHGFLGSKRNWESMCKKMTAYTNRTVIAVDARNHGDSPHHASHTYFDLAVDLSKLITKFSVEKGIIIGHSMGGRTGMTLALTEPSKIASLIVVDISPVSTSGSLTDFFPKLMEVMQSVDFTGMDTLHKAKTAAKNKIAESGITNNMDSMHFVLMNIGKLPDKSFGWKCNLAALQKNFDSVASFPNLDGQKFEGPTLFLGGRLSFYLPPEDITGIRQLFPTANLHYIKGAGHNVHAEEPNAFFNAVMQFLSFTALINHY